MAVDDAWCDDVPTRKYHENYVKNYYVFKSAEYQ